MDLSENPDFLAAEFGPRMQALGVKERRFVWCYVVGGGSATQAARDAGYSDASEACKVRAHELMHRERVLQAIEEVARLSFRGMLVPALSAMRALIDKPDHPDHARMVQSLLSRLGFGERNSVDVQVSGEVVVNHTDAALEQLRIFRDLGVPRAKLEELFGFSGLSRYERMLAEQEGKRPMKLIEGKVVDGPD